MQANERVAVKHPNFHVSFDPGTKKNIVAEKPSLLLSCAVRVYTSNSVRISDACPLCWPMKMWLFDGPSVDVNCAQRPSQSQELPGPAAQNWPMQNPRSSPGGTLDMDH